MNIKEFANKKQGFAQGHRSCRGCGFPIIVRNVLRVIDEPVVVVNATGCLEVTSTIYPYTSWDVPYIHNAFGNAASTISGIETAYKVLKKKRRINGNIKFVAFGGDGGTYDIGLQALSGAIERGHNFLYICYDNQAYMNTGGQRSSATTKWANTTTDPVGKVRQGKLEWRKDLTKIIIAHNISYAAQSACHAWNDLATKVKKAVLISGPTFINVLSPCTQEWKIDTGITIELSRLATETNFWPLYEYEKGKYKLNYRPFQRKQIIEFLKPQGRFKHLFKPENKKILDEIQKHVDEEWGKLVEMCDKI